MRGQFGLLGSMCLYVRGAFGHHPLSRLVE